jgi:serralysin
MATITGIVAASGDYDTNANDFDILLNAVVAAGLAAALDDPAADLTVFAPSDAAFLRLAETLGYEGTDEAAAFGYIADALSLLSGGGDPIPLLTDILKYHVAPESLTAAEVLNLSAIQTLLGVNIGVNGTNLEDGDPDVADPKLIQTDIHADNGIIHVIDGVLIPVDILQGDVDLVIGDDGRDLIVRNRGVDLIDGNGGNDHLFTGKDDDVVLGGTGNDKIFAGKGDDVLKGEDGRDLMFAGRDDDTITGGAGDDLLWGSQGGDTFVFAAGSGLDAILDFRIGEDIIDLSAFGFAGFEDLDLAHAKGRRVVIDLGDDEIIVHIDGRAKTLDADDFLFA